MINTLCLVVLAAPVPLVDAVDGEAVAWAHVPDARAALNGLSASPLAPWLGVLFPEPVRKALTSTQCEVAFAVYKSATPGIADWALWVDGPKSEPIFDALLAFWQQLGFARTGPPGPGSAPTVLAGGGRNVFLWCNEARCTSGTDRARVERMLAAAAKPLSAELSFRAAAEQRPSAAARLHVEVQKLYGLLARTSDGGKIAGVVRRLGLDAATALDASTSGANRDGLAGELRLLVPGKPTGLLGALGPSLPAIVPNDIPRDAPSWARLSVNPYAAWVMAEKLLAFLAPVEQTVARTQLDAVEKQGKRLDTDAFGETPRPWTFYQTRGGAWLSVLGIADSALAEKILGQLLRALPGVLPDLGLSESRVGQGSLLEVGWRGHSAVALGFSANALVVSGSAAAVRAQLGLASRGKPGKAQGSGEGAAFGSHDLGALLFPAGAGAAKGRAAPTAQGSWVVRPQPDGALVEWRITTR